MSLSSTQKQTPAQQGYRMPAEWETHEGTWLSWPKDPLTWPDRVPQVETIYEEMILALTPHEKVFLLVDDSKMHEQVTKRLEKRGVLTKNLLIYEIKTVDAWMRDYGPNFLIREKQGKKELAMNHWIFNAWGEKYKELMEDTRIPRQLSKQFKIPCFSPNIILEGGSIDVNGKGTVLTTEQCLLNPKRNPHLSKEEIETYLKDYLSVSQVIWLSEGIIGDDTDGHIDDITRFISEETIITAVEKDSNDANYPILQKNLKLLEAATDLNGKKWNIVKLPMPGSIGDEEGRLPASYANFYIANKVILVPLYDHKNDERALAILKEHFPDKESVGIQCEPLIYGLGALHCITQQQPKISS